MPALDPPEVQMDPDMVRKYEAEILVSFFLVICWIYKINVFFCCFFFRKLKMHHYQMMKMEICKKKK
jgi:hypothetical protein